MNEQWLDFLAKNLLVTNLTVMSKLPSYEGLFADKIRIFSVH
jgi:hypothetical protein